MHECPRCGQWCCCHGDIDDISVETWEYVAAHCFEDHDGCLEDEDGFDPNDDG